MNLAFKLKMAKQTAEKLLRDEGYKSLPIDLSAIAESRGILVKAKPPKADGVSGMLLRHGDNFMIVYATFIDTEGFQRFSIAHELGHYFLEGHIDHVLPKDGMHQSHAGFTSADPYEQEADSFAAGLIMPEALFRKALDKTEIGLPAVESMATLCRSSLTATAIRYAELTDQAVAAILSTGPMIDYCILSDKMKSLPNLAWLRKGSSVPKNTATARSMPIDNGWPPVIACRQS
jgi:Zn-dependent peptidase ImmA (M78 family)